MERQRRGAPPAPKPIDPRAPATDFLTVSQLTARVERVLKAGINQILHVRGELSNFRPHQGSGTLYFTLKDAATCVDCVMWRSDGARLKFQPADGMELLATGTIGVYAKAGKYQLYVTALRPLGKGALELAFQQRRAKLEDEGLFHPARKKSLPRFPMTIALVTGIDTAALQDMLKVLRRYAWLRLLIYPTPVQGESAAPRIADAIAHLSRCGRSLGIEAIILGRGGGSLEDLWAFNEEVVARAIAACSLPVITGIGHEVDTTIADLVADYHAHTPTEAAQVISATWRDARDEVDRHALRLRGRMANLLESIRQRLRNIERHEVFRKPADRINSFRQLLDDRQRLMLLAMTHRLHRAQSRVQNAHGRLDRRLPATVRRLQGRIDGYRQRLLPALANRLRAAGDRLGRISARLADANPKFAMRLQSQRLDSLSDRLARAARGHLLAERNRLDAIERQLKSISPQSVLQRGYSMTFRKKDGALLRGPEQVKPGDRLLTRFANGEVESVASDPRQPGLFDDA